MATDPPHSAVKCVSFKLSRIRFVTDPEVLRQALVVSGSWMDEVNRLCLWGYDMGELIDSGQFKPRSEQEDDISPGVLGDSADDPRLVDSLVHYGWVQDLKVHYPSHRIFSVSSLGSLQVLSANTSSLRLSRLTSAWAPFPSVTLPGNLPIALSSLSVSVDCTQVYVGDDLGRLAAVDVDRIPTEPNQPDTMKRKPDTYKEQTKADRSAVIEAGADIASVNALERVDLSLLTSVNQLGQLKVWDLRCGLDKPQQRLLRPSETQPLYCLTHHPGQPHLLTVGGVGGTGAAAAYIWDLRAEQYPLSELACEGRSVWEVGFHPRQPRHLYLATEAAGLLQISCRGDTASWTGFKGSRRKLTVSSALPGGTAIRDVISFDLSNTQLVCGHSDSIIQTVQCDVDSMY
ncbi:Nuclear pore complex protein Nup43 [Paragonimus skrjabini miyazakii]|uniref:Nuclear pore complex protein Nup43 n=1 Tax=Paragonimus skrjabini miyazakii TaxID=59628 RepID=A0A8S9YGN8_9TREM|nr:Nuclear pore complex protein Nup43 [Paragonimus skrjabini miyazakii]